MITAPRPQGPPHQPRGKSHPFFLRRGITAPAQELKWPYRSAPRSHFHTPRCWLRPAAMAIMTLPAPRAHTPSVRARLTCCRPTGQKQCFLIRKMGTFLLQMDFMATHMPPVCCISLNKTPMNINNRPTAPMAGPVGPVVKSSHFLRRVSTRNRKPATRHREKNVTYFYTLGCWLWPAMVVMMALLAPGTHHPEFGARAGRCRPTGQNQCFSRSHLVRLRLNV